MLKHSIKNFHKPAASKKLSFNDVINLPKIKKVVVHRSLGVKAQDNKILQQSLEEFRLITGQQPAVTRAKKSIAPFKIRANMPIGLKVTLRGQKMYSFIDRLIHLVLPQIKDFRGLSYNQFDSHANYHLGILDQNVFPEIETQFTDQKLGVDITIVTSLSARQEARQFLIELGFPFK